MSQGRFLALGDSYTIGESVEAAGRWPAQLVQRLRQRKVPIGDPEIIARTGWTTDELSLAIDAANPKGPYDLVTLLIGVNDQYRGGQAEDYRPRFRDLLRRAIGFAGGTPGRVVVVSIPDYGVMPFAAGRDPGAIASAIDRFNAVSREEAGRAGAHFVDVTPESRRASAHPELIAADHLHPSAAMYALWVDHIEPVVDAAFLGKPPERVAAGLPGKP
jgi:lysophospholipase L1-like esterase